MRIIIILLLLNYIYSESLPVAVFHGLGDSCFNPGMASFTKKLGEKIKNKSLCFNSGTGFLTSILDQSKKACEEIKKHEYFQGNFSVLGLSQGALIARYIIEECEIKGKVLNFVSIGGPQMGVSKVPHCGAKNIECGIINKLAEDVIYSDYIQNYIGPAGYFRSNDFKHISKYYSHSNFLAPLNNESISHSVNEKYKERFLKLERIQLIMFSKDTMIIPKETAWFGFYNSDGEVLDYKQTELYKKDLIGLKTIDEAGKLHFDSIDGDHLQFNMEDVDEKVVPYLS